MAALILAFDTSGPHCTAALTRGEDVIAQASVDMAKGQAEHLMGMLGEVLAAGEVTYQALTAIGVGVGPGNFTGIRISVSAARGLALGLSIPAIGVSVFEAYADPDARELLTLPAPRDTRYAQSFHGYAPHGPARHLTLDQFGHERLPERQIKVDRTTLARSISQVALRKLNAGAIGAPKPLYVKALDAAPPRDAGPKILP
mgnify:CR=1 FL=1